MPHNIPLINLSTNVVDNVIVAEYTDPCPEGYKFGPPGGQIGWTWDNGKYIDPNPPPITVPPDVIE